jgi:hypothetical protein
MTQYVVQKHSFSREVLLETTDTPENSKFSLSSTRTISDFSEPNSKEISISDD